MACAVCKGRSYVLAGEGNHAVARVCECARPCKVCGGARVGPGEREGEVSPGTGPRPTPRRVAVPAAAPGKGRLSPFELETLDELISRRYNAGRTTLFGTNYSLRPPDRARAPYVSSEDLKQAGKESQLLYDRVGDRIYSRLCEMCDFV